MLDPATWTPINCRRDQQPILVVVVDTEAEFDWAAGTTRRVVGVNSVRAQVQTLPIFERYGIRPTFVLDYPVSSTPDAYEFMRDLYASGACEIGAHLQPWDTPPLVEQKTERNSYPGNLPFELERGKLLRLTEIISRNLNVRPRIYKAGRYGVGPQTARILAELGYEIDLSVLPGTDLSREFGPDFSRCEAGPYWFGNEPALLEIPLTIGYTGLLASTGRIAKILTTHPSVKALHIPGVLARLHLLDRIILTPEGVTFNELRRLTRALLRRGHRIFSLTYHSPSLEPGNTPYVRNTADLHALLERTERYLDFFMGEVGGRSATPYEVKVQAMQDATSSAELPAAQSG